MRRSEIEYPRPGVLPGICPGDYIEAGEFDFENELSPDYVEPGNSPAMLKKLSELYFYDRADDLMATRERLGRLQSRDRDVYSDIPRSTIVILTIEDAETLRGTMSELAKQHGVEQDEIILYGNMPGSFSEEQKQEKDDVLDTIVAEFPSLRIRSINETYDWSEHNDSPLMGKLRHDYKAMIALDGAERGFGVDHPVITLDGDTKLMTQGSLDALVAAITYPQSNVMIAHLETRYTFDAQEGPLSDARKLAVLQEIRRRQLIRLRNSGDRPFTMPYNEEWGAAVALGAYLVCGGYNDHGQFDENSDLKKRMIIARDEITAVMQHAKPGIKEPMSPEVQYTPGKVIRGSARRHEDLFNNWIAEPLNTDRELLFLHSTELYGWTGLQYDDSTFSSTDTAREKNRTPATFTDAGQMKCMVNAILLMKSVRHSGEPEMFAPDPSRLLERLGLIELSDTHDSE